MTRIPSLASLLAGTALALTALGASAQHGRDDTRFSVDIARSSGHRVTSLTPMIDGSLAEQARRIELGWRHGELSRGELRRLQRQHRDIVEARQQVYRDRHVSQAERTHLRVLLAQADDDIARALHNRRTAHDDRWGADHRDFGTRGSSFPRG